jgi:hypothetical protein
MLYYFWNLYSDFPTIQAGMGGSSGSKITMRTLVIVLALLYTCCQSAVVHGGTSCTEEEEYTTVVEAMDVVLETTTGRLDTDTAECKNNQATDATAADLAACIAKSGNELKVSTVVQLSLL